MKVSFFDLRRMYFQQQVELDSAIRSVLESGQYILGQTCQAFEDNFKKYLMVDASGEVVTCNSGTDALVLSLLGSGVRAGDSVLVVSHTAIPTVSAICSVEAVPDFIDIDSKTWLMDLNLLRSAIRPQTKAIIAVHLYGNMVAVPKIKEILKKLGREDISIIEDVAQAQGATFHAHQAGTLGRFGAFSFYPTKNLGALGDGGAVFCKSREDATLIRLLHNYGKDNHQLAKVSRGINSRLDEIQAAILNTRLTLLSKWNLKKAAMMARYRQEYRGLPIEFQETTPDCCPAWHLCVIALENEAVRNQLKVFLGEHEIQTLIHYPVPTHLHAGFALKNSYFLPHTENLAKRILSLPLNPSLGEDEQEYIIKVTRSFFQ